ncbi:MAG: glutathione peroxidase [Peptostreptococcaceae bacterium]|nr:glutathione peroxidase [Peptostreptococcaceae bacterium]MDY5739832.1 glutathione peroxidase [Anaerovoracaceae bacterium]
MSIYEYKVKDGEGAEISMEEFSGKVLLIVNTASKCGFTPQFDGLEKLYKKYKDKGLAVVGFPCNQFGAQDPGTDEEIQGFCRLNYGVTFPMMSKIDVNGDGEDLLYTYLKSQKKGLMGSKIKWNFTKFLVDREGNVVKRFAPTDKPEDLEKHILKLL